MNWNLIIIILLITTGISIFLYEFFKLKRILKGGIRTQAKRIGLKTIRGDDGERIDLPLIEFQNLNGNVIQTKLNSNIHNNKKNIDIIYDPNNPKYVIPNYWTKHIPWMFGVLVFLLCIIFLIVELA